MRCETCGAETRSTGAAPDPAAVPGSAPGASQSDAGATRGTAAPCADCASAPTWSAPSSPTLSSSALSGDDVGEAGVAPPIQALLDTSADGRDDCEEMLRRAIAMVRGVDRSARMRGPGRYAAPLADAAIPEIAAPATAVDDGESDECAVLLARAIAMIRGSSSSGLTRSKPVRLVELRRDPADTAYVAIDTKSGLSILRHRDSTRLRMMCDRIGWRIIASEVDGADSHPIDARPASQSLAEVAQPA